MTRLSDIMGAAGLSSFAIAALLLFVLAFVLVLFTILAPSRRAQHERAALLPFDDGGAPPSVPRETPQ